MFNPFKFKLQDIRENIDRIELDFLELTANGQKPSSEVYEALIVADEYVQALVKAISTQTSEAAVDMLTMPDDEIPF